MAQIFKKDGFWCFEFILDGIKRLVSNESYKEAENRIAWLLKKGITVLTISGAIYLFFR